MSVICRSQLMAIFFDREVNLVVLHASLPDAAEIK